MKLNKKQKRTATIASMAALLAVVLGMGGQTFAKYITTQSASATATVAKWGVVINADASELFGSKYEDNVINASGDDIVAGGDYDVVAPGSSGFMNFVVSGQPEVAAKITFVATGTDVSLEYNVKANADDDVGTDDTYFPIKWTLTNNNTATDVVDGGELTEVLSELNDLTSTYTPDDDPLTSIDLDYTLSWAWEFSEDTVISYRDTVLGNYAANDTIVDPNTSDLETYTSVTKNFSFSLNIKVEQVQN